MHSEPVRKGYWWCPNRARPSAHSLWRKWTLNYESCYRCLLKELLLIISANRSRCKRTTGLISTDRTGCPMDSRSLTRKVGISNQISTSNIFYLPVLPAPSLDYSYIMGNPFPYIDCRGFAYRNGGRGFQERPDEPVPRTSFSTSKSTI